MASTKVKGGNSSGLHTHHAKRDRIMPALAAVAADGFMTKARRAIKERPLSIEIKELSSTSYQVNVRSKGCMRRFILQVKEIK